MEFFSGINTGDEVLSALYYNFDRDSAIRLFYIISEMNALYFAPQLPYFLIILLHFYNEDIVYSVK